MLFINCTQHEINVKQLKAIKELNIKHIYDLKWLEHRLFARLASSPDNKQELETLADDFISYVDAMLRYEENTVYFHLPIGSPAFQFILAVKIYQYDEDRLKVVFSHSERISVDNPDGTKTTKFEFKHFIEL